MFGFNYFDKYDKEQLEQLLSDVTEFQTWQALGLFLAKASWLFILISTLWNAGMTTINKFVFGILFFNYPFLMYLFRELGFNIGIRYTSLMIGVSMFVFIMNGAFNMVDNVVSDVADALDRKQNNKEDNDYE